MYSPLSRRCQTIILSILQSRKENSDRRLLPPLRGNGKRREETLEVFKFFRMGVSYSFRGSHGSGGHSLPRHALRSPGGDERKNSATRTLCHMGAAETLVPHISRRIDKVLWQEGSERRSTIRRADPPMIISNDKK